MSKIELYNADCLDKMKDIPNGSVDMILCDLPYGTTSCKWDTIIPFETLWGEYNRIIKPNGCIALFGSEPFSSKLRMSNLKDYRYDWYWEKTKVPNFLHKKKMPGFAIETISIFYKKLPIYNFEKLENKNGFVAGQSIRRYEREDTSTHKNVTGNTKSKLAYSEDYDPNLVLPNNLLSFSNYKNGNNNFHHAQKPVALLEYLIKTYTLEGETVLDNTMGSGSTGVACKNLNRNFIGIEKDESYFKIAKERIEKHTAQQFLGFGNG